MRIPARPGKHALLRPEAREDSPGPGFALSLTRCVGCGACVLACRIENGLPQGVSWRRILQVNEPRIGGGPTYHLSVACHHCEHAPCIQACPSGALRKGEDGLVLLESGLCIGCRYCEMACPFGAPSFDTAAGLMTKCHLCHHRLSEGLAPACVAACPTGALDCVLPKKGEGSGSGVAASDLPTRTFRIPGFADPAGAVPGLWLFPPGGAIREEWFRELQALLEGREEDADDEA